MYKRLIISVLILIAVSCDNTNGNDDSGLQPERAEFKQVTTSIPDTTTNPNALTVKYTVEGLTNSFALLTNLFSVMDSYTWIHEGNKFTYSVSNSEVTFTYEITDNGDGSFDFKYFVNGLFENVTLTNFVLFSGTYNSNGTSGSWNYFGLNGNSESYKVVNYNWTANETSTTFNMTFYDESGNTESYYSIIVNNDGSGSLTVTESGRITLTASWTNDGHGSLSYYDSEEIVTNTYNW